LAARRFSAWFLRARFSARQVCGAVLVVLGACLAIIPRLGHDAGGGGTPVAAGWVALYFAADLPMSLSAVYKDYAFKRGRLGVFHLTAAVSWLQLVLLWLYLPLLSIDQLGGFDLKSIPSVFEDGARCFAGYVRDTASSSPAPALHQGRRPHDD